MYYIDNNCLILYQYIMKRSSESKYLKTAEYARQIGCTQRTVHRNFHKGLIPGFQDKKTKTIYIENPDYSSSSTEQFLNRAILYARVSSSDNRKSLDGQLERMRSYCSAKGYTIVDEIKEIRSGLNDQRPKLDQILKREDYDLLVCEHKDRLTRFGFHYLETLLERCGIQIVVINQMDTKDQELMDDFVSIVTSFCNRIYGRKRKKKTEKIIEEIRNNNDEHGE